MKNRARVTKTVIVTQPSIEPLTLAQAKAHLRVDFSTDDDLITAMITSARIECENEVDQKFIQTEIDFYLDVFPYYIDFDTIQTPSQRINACTITLPFSPIISVESVKYYDLSGTLQTFSSTLYNSATGTPGRVSPACLQIWPIAQERLDAVVIRALVGHGTAASSVPECVRSAIKLRIGDLYENRESIELNWTARRILDPLRW